MDFYLAFAPGEVLTGRLKGAALCCPFEAAFSPPAIPAGTLLVLTDSARFGEHSADALASQLLPIAENSPAILLDFQRHHQEGLPAFVRRLGELLPCPVVPPPEYAADTGPVFLPPIPPDCLPEDHLSPWKGREIWLDLAASAEALTLTPAGCRRETLDTHPVDGFRDGRLFCHYHILRTGRDAVRFSLWRTGGDLIALLDACKGLGVQNCVGLYPELPEELIQSAKA